MRARNHKSRSFVSCLRYLPLTLSLGVFAQVAPSANAQIYVDNQVNGVIGAYDGSTGSAINASLIKGPLGPQSIAVYGSDIFVASDSFDGSTPSFVSEYTRSGTLVNADLITGPSSGVTGLSVSDSGIFVSYGYDFTIAKYSLSGTPIDTSFITNVNELGLAVSGSELFVANPNAGAIDVYSAATGALLRTIADPAQPYQIAVEGNDIFVTNMFAGSVGEYSTTGATINADLISGLTFPFDLAVSGSNLIVAGGYDGLNSYISEYTTTGVLENPSFISIPDGLDFSLAVSQPAAISDTTNTAALLGIVVLGICMLHWRRNSGSRMFDRG